MSTTYPKDRFAIDPAIAASDDTDWLLVDIEAAIARGRKARSKAVVKSLRDAYRWLSARVLD